MQANVNKPQPVPFPAYLGLFLAALALYVLTMPVNHTEAGDRHAYAYWAETLPLNHLIDTRSILFTILNRSLYLGSEALGLGLPATTLATTYSVLAGAGALVLMARLLNRHLSVEAAPAIAGAALLGLSYGFWRYAQEIEVYVASMFLILAALNFLLDRLEQTPLNPWRFVVPGAVSGLIVMFYQPNIFPLFLAVPVLFLSRDRFPPFIVYGAAGTLTVILSFVLAYLFARDDPLTVTSLAGFIGSRNAEFDVEPFDLGEMLKLLLAVSHTFLSSNWIFGVEPLSDAFAARFPLTETHMKILSAAHFRPWVYAPLVLMPVLAVTMWLLLRAIRPSIRPGWRIPTFLLAWIVIYGLVAGRLDPGVTEVWIPLLSPFVTLIAVFVIAPAWVNGARRPVLALLAIFALWNWFGGIGMLKNPQGDFLARQSAWLEANATEKDVVVLTEWSWKVRTYMTHVLPAGVIYIAPPCVSGSGEAVQALADLRKSTAATGGRVFAFADFVVPPSRFDADPACPARMENAYTLRDATGDATRQVAGEGAFAIYEILPPK